MIWFFYTTFFAVGAIIGSFLNVVIHRGPARWELVEDESREGSLATPRSYCPLCKTPIKRRHLLPIVSFFALQGKCAACSNPISKRYVTVEFCGALAALLSAIVFGPSIEAICASIFLWLLIALAVIDLETGFLPDVLTITLIFLGIAFNTIDMFTPMPDAIIGAFAGYAIFRVIGAAFLALRGLEGLGLGDAKLLAGLGAWLGWQALAPIVLIGALTNLAIIAFMVSRGAKIERETEIPFGPALAMAGAIFMLVSVLLR